MPASNFDQGSQTLLRYDVLGQWAEGQTRFVKHVGLFDEQTRSAQRGDEAAIIHMGPPLERGRMMSVHVAGRVPLTSDETNIISTWFEKIKDEYPRIEPSNPIEKFRQYVIHPPWKDADDRNTKTRRYRRYSCAGFVLESHRQVKIDLLDIDEKILPPVDIQTIMLAYPGFEKCSDVLLGHWGLKGVGPWNVVLAGYVMHALDRPTDQIRNGPYRAKLGDEQF